MKEFWPKIQSILLWPLDPFILDCLEAAGTTLDHRVVGLSFWAAIAYLSVVATGGSRASGFLAALVAIRTYQSNKWNKNGNNNETTNISSTSTTSAK